MSAEILFGVATAVITISLVVLTYSWQTLKEMISSLPEGQRKLQFKLEGIIDQRHKTKAELVIVQCLGCVSFVLSIALALISILGITSVLLGYHFGFYEQQNYDAGRACLYISIFFFFLGFFFIGLNYALRLISLLRGSQDSLSTPVPDLPAISEKHMAEVNLFQKHYFIAFVVFLLISFLLLAVNIFVQWFDYVIALSVSVLVFYLMRMMLRRKPRQATNTTNQPH